MNPKARYLIPNGITFASLACGTIAILLATRGELLPSGIAVVVSYVLDMFDGATARKLKAGTGFGLQLDSLVDMVSHGVAPVVIAFVHLESKGLPVAWVWAAVIAVPSAGAFRLARFNLMPAKESGMADSVGLPTPTAGVMVALAVLSDLVTSSALMAHFILIPLMGILSLLMVSRIAFPSIYWIFSRPIRAVVVVSLCAASLLAWPFFYAAFLWSNAYVGYSLARAQHQLRSSHAAS